MKKVIMFDFDYTLGDSSEGIMFSVQYALQQMGLSNVSRNAIINTIGLSLADTYTALTGRTAPKEINRFEHYFVQKAEDVMVKNTTIYAKIPDMLEHIHHKGIKTAIVTTKYHIRIEQILTANNLSHLIDGIIGADDVSQPKPSPEGILLLRQHFQTALSDMLYVGDSFVDAQAAQAAGVDFIAVLTGTTPAESFAKYPHIGILNAASALQI